MGTVRLPALLAGVAAFTVGRVERSGDARSAGTVAAAANGTRGAVLTAESLPAVTGGAVVTGGAAVTREIGQHHRNGELYGLALIHI